MDFDVKVTREKVFAAADALVGKGIKPTQQLLKEALGGGSFTSISPFHREWKELQHKSAVTTSTPPPEAVTRSMTLAAEQIWALAQETAETLMAGEREALHAASLELADRENEMLLEITSNESEIQRLGQALHSLQESATTAAAEAADARLGFEQKIGELNIENARLDESLKTVRAQLERARRDLSEATEKHEQAAQKAAGQLEIERNKRGDLQHDLDVEKGKLEVVLAELASEKQQTTALKASADQAGVQLEKAQDQVARLTQQVETQAAQATAQAEGQQRLIEQLQQQLDKERGRCDTLQQQLVEIAREKGAGKA